MKKLLNNPAKFYQPKARPSGHQIAKAFAKRNAGAIPSNLLQIPNTDSASHYLRACKLLGRDPHPARFPSDLPKFFINFLTEPGDIVLDIFSGSNTTGLVAESMKRRWLSVEIDRAYAKLSAVRFLEGWLDDEIAHALELLDAGRCLDLDRSPQPRAEAARSSPERPARKQPSLFSPGSATGPG
jgi:site-specific DNA-methyltransferase (cytosine-N4-specific)